MKLLEMLIVENVEKLLPHLERQIEDYIQKRSTGQELPRYYRDTTRLAKMVLNADPKYLKDHGRKPLNQVKAPFAQHIARWWLHPNYGGGISLPEDTNTTLETLQKLNIARQKGFNADIASFNTDRKSVV